MGQKNHFAWASWGITLSFLVVFLTVAHALNASTVVLTGSTKPVATVPTTGLVNPRKPYISRQKLTAAETAAPMTFEIVLKMRNFSELQARVSRGEHLSSQEIASKYEPLPADYQTVADWLKSQGFTIVRQSSRHLAIFARGNVSQIAQALNVNFSRVTSEGKEYSSAVAAPSVPTNIAPLLVGINGLQPHIRAHKHLIKQQAQPDASGGSASYLPSQIAQAYGATGLYNTSINGTGQTIAIIIDTFPSTSDLESFWNNANVNQSINNISFIQAVQGTLPVASDGDGEETLDTEWSSAIAPGAHIRIYATLDLTSADLDTGYQQVLDDVTDHPEYHIHQMTMSYGQGETYTTASQVQTDDQFFVELTAAGVTCFASSGDGGSTPGPNGSGDETGPLQVESPASDPNVTGVGGTSLTLNSSNNETNEVVWNNSDGSGGGGTSIYFSRPGWQTGTGLPSGTMREVPDVACAADPNRGAIIYFSGSEETVGGTSWASPTWAGFCALINQARANANLTPMGMIGPNLYALLGSANYSTNIRDITSGNNATHTSGSTNGIPNYTAGTGYDRTTGIGVPLVQALSQTFGAESTLLQMPQALQSISPGDNATFTAVVSGNSATYQWQRMPIGSTTWSSLSDNSTYSGSTTASLTITNASASMSGDQFQCVINLGGNVVTTTTPSILIVDSPLVISPLAGVVRTTGLQNGSGTSAYFNYPSGVAVDGSGTIYVADFSNNQIRVVTPAGAVSTPFSSTLFEQPNGVAVDASDNLYVVGYGNNLILKIIANTSSPHYGEVTTLAGASGYAFNAPEGIAVDGSGNVYVADTGNDVIEEITSSGNVSILAGQTGNAGYADGAATTKALFNGPSSVAVDSSGNVYVADFGNNVVRKISTVNNVKTVSTLAGQAGVPGYLDGLASEALFNTPCGLGLDSSGNLYVTDCLVPGTGSTAAGNDLIRKISTTGVVSTLAGQVGTAGSSNGTGTAAQFYSVQAVALNTSTGTVYLADTFNQTIRMGIPLALPTVTVTAAVPEATVFGSVPGQFTVARTGTTTGSLTVNYSVGGSAIPNTDYTALPEMETLTIPVGSTSAAIMVDPISDPSATSSRTVQLTLNSSASYTLGSPTSATVSIEEPTAYQSWKLTYFGSNAATLSTAADTADPNNNGVPNLLEYAFNANPLQTGTEPLPTYSTVESGGQDYLAITFTQLQPSADPNLTYTVQVTSDLTQQTDTWHSGSSYTTVYSQISNPDGSGTLITTVRDNTPLSSTTRRFMRLQVTGN